MILSDAWTPHSIFIWSSYKPLTSMKGKYILSFIKLIPKVVSFIKTQFMDTCVLENLTPGLCLWWKIFLSSIEL